MDKLSNCPWCFKLEQLKVSVPCNDPPEDDWFLGGFQVFCQVCDIHGPTGETEEDCIQKWNTRAQSREAKVLEKVKEELKQKPYLGFDGIEAAEHLEFLIKQWEEEE